MGQGLTTEPFVTKDRIPKDEANMDDFPIWLKAVIYLIVAATIVYVIGASLHAFLGN